MTSSSISPFSTEKPKKEKPAEEEAAAEPEEDETNVRETRSSLSHSLDLCQPSFPTFELQLTEEQLIEKKIANSRKLTPEECLFCGHFSDNFDQ